MGPSSSNETLLHVTYSEISMLKCSLSKRQELNYFIIDIIMELLIWCKTEDTSRAQRSKYAKGLTSFNVLYLYELISTGKIQSIEQHQQQRMLESITERRCLLVLRQPAFCTLLLFGHSSHNKQWGRKPSDWLLTTVGVANYNQETCSLDVDIKSSFACSALFFSQISSNLCPHDNKYIHCSLDPQPKRKANGSKRIHKMEI